jgi:hypothetical protein
VKISAWASQVRLVPVVARIVTTLPQTMSSSAPITAASLIQKRAEHLQAIAVIERQLAGLREKAQLANYLAWLGSNDATKPLVEWIRKHAIRIEYMSNGEYRGEQSNCLQNGRCPTLLTVTSGQGKDQQTLLSITSTNNFQSPPVCHLAGGGSVRLQELVSPYGVLLSSADMSGVAASPFGELLGSMALTHVLRCFVIYPGFRADELVTRSQPPTTKADLIEAYPEFDFEDPEDAEETIKAFVGTKLYYLQKSHVSVLSGSFRQILSSFPEFQHAGEYMHS